MSRSAGPSSKNPARVLVVDDDAIAAEALAEFLHREGYDTAHALSADEALAALAAADAAAASDEPGAISAGRPFNLVLSDVAMPGSDGLELLREITRRFPTVVVIMISGYGTIEQAVAAVRAGAVDFLAKPIVDKELKIALERALRQQALLAENRRLRDRLDDRFGLAAVVGSDHRMVRILDLVSAVAPSKTTVLMTGESGTGKSLIARAIHERSPRRDKAFVEISCGSIPETLLESELFGHAKGAFTGAYADKQGKFAAADGGTIFLDEINSAPASMQLKLLRVLQERRFEPVGSNRTVEVDVRVVLASNQPLETLVAEGRFRQDLYYRINVVTIELPPLRERADDIPVLAAHFLRQHAGELGKQIAGFSPEATAALVRYRYPGNVRELSNIVERAAVLTRGQTIALDDLPAHVIENAPGGAASRMSAGATGGAASEDAPWIPMALDEAMREPERRFLIKALKANDWNRQKTAEQLGINRTTLYKKMKDLGIDEQQHAPA
jgi:DNA-binding NtrC family response regulator